MAAGGGDTATAYTRAEPVQPAALTLSWLFSCRFGPHADNLLTTAALVRLGNVFSTPDMMRCDYSGCMNGQRVACTLQRAKLLLALREVGLDLDAQVLQEEGLEPVKAAKLPKPKEEGSDVRDAKVCRADCCHNCNL